MKGLSFHCKTIGMFLLVFASFIELTGQNSNPNYDAALAAKLGADDYGMKSYVFVVLKSGENKTTEKKFIDSCFSGHLRNIDALAKEGKLLVAGPFGKNTDDFRGLFILNVTTVEEGLKMLESDPAIAANLLKPVLYPWYGSAALSEYLTAADKVWKLNP